VTTGLSILLGIAVNNELIRRSASLIATIVFGNVALLVVLAGFSIKSWHWAQRLAASFAAAIAIGALCQLTDNEFSNSFRLIPYHLLQSIVFFLWFELAPVIAQKGMFAVGDAESAIN
jgi:hypothetical protein